MLAGHEERVTDDGELARVEDEKEKRLQIEAEERELRHRRDDHAEGQAPPLPGMSPLGRCEPRDPLDQPEGLRRGRLIDLCNDGARLKHAVSDVGTKPAKLPDRNLLSRGNARRVKWRVATATREVH